MVKALRDLPGVDWLRRRYHLARSVVALGKQVAVGAAEYRRTGKTSQETYLNFIELFCRTQGRSNDLLHGLVRLAHARCPLPPARGLLGDFEGEALGRAGRVMRADGYYRFPGRLPDSLLNGLEAFARTTQARVMYGGDEASEEAIYDPSRPIATKYNFDEHRLLANPVVRQVVFDPAVLALSQEYLGCAPVFSNVCMWWSTRWSSEPSVGAGQLFHFDMDRIRWLKFFILLTDVSEKHGPTTFIAGTHRSGMQPRPLLDKGYSRLTDEEVLRHYPKERVIHFTGKRGTVVACDTRGFHKGEPLLEGDRLVLQVEFADSLFGAGYSRPVVELEEDSPYLALFRACPRVFERVLVRVLSRAPSVSSSLLR